jgi:hypothetical protein
MVSMNTNTNDTNTLIRKVMGRWWLVEQQV